MRLRLLILLLLTVSACAQTTPQNAAIIIYRPHRAMGAAFYVPVLVDNQLVGMTGSGRYFSVTVPPGKHVVSMPKQKNVVTPVELDLAPGGEAFVRVRIEGCWGDCNLFLFPMDAATAQADLAKMTPSEAVSVNEHAEALPYVPGAAAVRKLTLGQPPPQPAVATPAPPPVAPQPKPGSVVIISQPGGADVYIQGTQKGTTSAADGRFEYPGLAPSSYTIRLARPEFEDWTTTLTLTEGETKVIVAKLVRRGPPPLTLREIEDALQKGLPKARVATLVKQYGVDFDVDDSAERRLRAAGADGDLLLTIAKSKR